MCVRRVICAILVNKAYGSGLRGTLCQYFSQCEDTRLFEHHIELDLVFQHSNNMLQA